MKRQWKSHLEMLPEDLLADVLRRLPPRSLRVSRCVCKAWRAIVDVHKLLRADLLPLSFGGIMIGFNMLGHAEFLSYRGPGCAAAAVSGNLGYLLRPNIPVDAPATTSAHAHGYDRGRPISPYYEVFLTPVVHPCAELDRATAESEWPPLLCETHVFSSRTGCWEKRSFVREGDPAGTTAVIQQARYTSRKRYSVYWREALYIHCPNDFLCKVSVTDNKYQVIKPPAVTSNLGDGPRQAYLGKSENGVYCAILDL
ncbi:uncharacterized protein [Miscanthus floridulus]|uniref:uncharacterized protein n=1 Tax=Miscanthus floridulus TaxID=154761 RepID=UPI00345AABA1